MTFYTNCTVSFSQYRFAHTSSPQSLRWLFDAQFFFGGAIMILWNWLATLANRTASHSSTRRNSGGGEGS